LGLEEAFVDDLAAALRPRAAGTAQVPELDFLSPVPAPPIRFRSPIELGARLTRQLLGLRGESVVNVSACAAGGPAGVAAAAALGLAVARAAALMARGQAEVVLCGGADSMLNPFGLAWLARLHAPSPRAAADACRPFDRQRDGLAVGEGAAVFVVESLARARA